MNRSTRTRLIATAVLVPFLLGACTTDPYTGERKISNTALGAGIGAAVGAIGGAVVGGSNKRKSVLIGAGIGALAGGAIGVYMDAQEAKLRRQLEGTGVSVTRDGDNIYLNMPGNVTFGSDSDQVQANFAEVLTSVSLVVREYNKTYVDVLGHTDSTGADSYNMDLSLRRASSVAANLTAAGVEGERLIIRGLGETMPIADNGSAEGRSLNRRVEIALSPLT